MSIRRSLVFIVALLAVAALPACAGIPVNVTRGLVSPEPAMVQARADFDAAIAPIAAQLVEVRALVTKTDAEQGTGSGLGALIASILGTTALGIYGTKRASTALGTPAPGSPTPAVPIQA